MLTKTCKQTNKLVVLRNSIVGLSWGSICWNDNLRLERAGSIKRRSNSVSFIIGFSRFRKCGVQAPFGLQRFLHFLGIREFEVANFTGNDGTLMSRLQFGHQFGLEFASFLRVQVADFLRNVDEGSDGLVVALFGAFFGDATSSADLNWQLFARGITNEFACESFKIDYFSTEHFQTKSHKPNYLTTLLWQHNC